MNIKYNCRIWVVVFWLFNYSANAQDLVKYVQPMAGSGAATTPAALKHGSGTELFANTIPAVTTPFAMTQWSPQTQTSENKCIAPYRYSDNYFSGIRASHWLSGSCTQDYGSFTIMPVSSRLRTLATDYAVKFNHTDEYSSPYYYRIDLNNYGLKVAVTSTPRCAIIKVTALRADSVYLLISPNSDYNEGFVKVDPGRGEVEAYNPVHRIYQGWGKEAGFKGYFVARMEKAAGSSGSFASDTLYHNATISNKKNIGVYLGFKLKAGESICMKVGTSFSSISGARKNLDAEIPGWKPGPVVAAGKAKWQKALSQIGLNTAIEKDKRIFYTSLYHAMQQPRLYNDVDGSYPEFASANKIGRLKKGNYYDDFSLWDVYRAHLPLFELLKPSLINDVVNSFILKGQQGGWLPIFPCWNSYTSEMIGDHSSSVIASAYLKGIGNFNAAEAYRLIRKNAFDTPANKADYAEGKGRRALDSYLKYHYIPVEDSVPDAFHKKEQVSRTLEYAYDDYAVAMMAAKMGKTGDYKVLAGRAGYYRNVFDQNKGMVRGRHADGSWTGDFKPDNKAYYITEGTPRQYTFYVPQDVTGLAGLMGGRSKLEAALDSIFIKNEYWHGNEPGHQIPFMYNFTSAPWKTQQRVREILATEYGDGPGGLSGNDDAGQMSAWYIFASIGLYPLNPVSGEYLLSSPIFGSVSMHLGNGKTFRINTHKRVNNAGYIYAVKWNGKNISNNYISYKNIINGGRLDVYLQDKPDLKWGIKAAMQPKSSIAPLKAN
ncbi:GH92 family glycosyl hydrolase [Mucilaginibacter ginsenosidivorax]|uniref:Glycoside hydrolase family 92 protein n=1 Tax=Mucilaginibacter ginsenosidivorax TaxID=862126 RepID=A0A5B8W8I5_9SPHI|nr:GH92 family glycosyl hydrolase [Mucilaginibacter ginsenosidivorax]QEC78548.1 glycoside hydrolase family 92 protein [Mucilaginibacter ginsenosidivorax]